MCIQAAHSSAQGYSVEFRLAPEPPFPPCDDVPIRAAATHPHLPLETSLHEVHAAQREMMTSRAVTSGLRRANGGQPRPDPLRASSAAEAPEHAEPRTAFVTPDPGADPFGRGTVAPLWAFCRRRRKTDPGSRRILSGIESLHQTRHETVHRLLHDDV